MTVAQQGSPILDPDLRSQPLREAACHGLCPLSDSDATLGTEGRRPDGCHTPLCAAGAGPYGNTAAPPTGIYCHWQYLLSVPRSFADAQDDSGRRSPDPRSRSSIPAAPRLHAHHNPHARRRVKLSPSPFGTPYHLSLASSGTIKIRADNPHGPSGRVQCTKKEPQFPAALSALIH